MDVLYRSLWASSAALALSHCVPIDARDEGGPSAAKPEAASPLATYALPAADRIRFHGHVVDRVVTGPYAYLALEHADGDRSWVVTLSSSDGAKPGVNDVDVVAVGHARSFASARLGRTFDNLYFAVVRPR